MEISDRSCVLLLDRTTDLVGPLLHPTTYQSLLEDLFLIENNRLYLLYPTENCYFDVQLFKGFTFLPFPRKDIIWDSFKDKNIDELLMDFVKMERKARLSLSTCKDSLSPV